MGELELPLALTLVPTTLMPAPMLPLAPTLAMALQLPLLVLIPVPMELDVRSVGVEGGAGGTCGIV